MTEEYYTGKEDTIVAVGDFHRAFEQAVPDKITIDDDKVNKLRISLLQEELDELYEALFNEDEVAVLDALTDLQYVLDGAYVSFGMGRYKTRAFNEVHSSNMSKLDEQGKVIKREDGKAMKGPNYRPPDLKKVIYG